MNVIRMSHVYQLLLQPLIAHLSLLANPVCEVIPMPGVSRTRCFTLITVQQNISLVSPNTGSDDSETKLETEHQQVFIECLVSLVEYVKFSGSDILGIKVGHTARPS